ncbi:MAG: hypothetical protein ACXADS_06625 [Candidatus Thorarchaeota archaeon]|jgi:hypothetical protein
MALHERIPDQLKLRDEMISVSLEDDVSVFPTSEYVLLELSHKAGKINIPKIAATVRDLVRNDRRMVAIRGYGFKGVGLSVRVAHELKKREQRFVYEMAFDTFEATDPETSNPLTSVQIVVMPPE